MFNEDFYPTPDNVIATMLSSVSDVNGMTILEPSAGSGAILDYLKKYYAPKSVLACERDPRLKHIAAAKSDRFISDDFLQVRRQDVSHVNLIIMNPPFSQGSKHLAHAWEILPDGGQIVCLLNSGTLKHAMGESGRMLSAALRDYGYVTYLGECFKSAERRTNVEVDMVVLNKPISAEDDNFTGFFMDQEPEELQGNGIMRYNDIRDIVNRYVEAVKIFKQHEELAKQMNSVTSPFKVGGFVFNMEYNNTVTTQSDFLIQLQKKAWISVFNKLKLEKFLTTKVMEKVNKFAENQQNVPFTMKNIYRMIDIIIGTRQQNLNAALVEAIDNFTKHTKENRYGVEGWVTNEGHFLNKKFIMPYGATYEYGHLSVQYNSHYLGYFNDLVKVLCNLNGLNYDLIGCLRDSLSHSYKIFINDQQRFATRNDFKPEEHTYPWGSREDDYTLKEALKKLKERGLNCEIVCTKVKPGEWFDFAFFRIKGYKKGTFHIEFKDLKVWENLNRAYGKSKGMVLPETFK